MCEACKTYGSLVVNQRNFDPTRTTGLRQAFVRDLRRRFRDLERVIRVSIDDNDALGLRPSTFQEVTPAPRQAFAFPRNQDKITTFQEWIQRQINAGLLETGEAQQIGTAVEQAWTNTYITDSYKRGVIRARMEMRKAGYDVPLLNDDISIANALNSPFHIDRIGVLYTRTFSELRGITSQMDQQLSRVLAQGLIDGDGPRVISRKLLKVINGLGDFDLTDTLGRYIPAKRRAEIMARTEIIRAHHHATIQEYKNWGVAGVFVQAEFVTAQDDRVCPDCQALEGTRYNLDEALGVIPVHPQCRCIMLPVRRNETITI